MIQVLHSLEFFSPIQECHVLFFLNSSKVRIKVWVFKGLPESNGFRRIVGGEGWPGAVGAWWDAMTVGELSQR